MRLYRLAYTFAAIISLNNYSIMKKYLLLTTLCLLGMATKMAAQNADFKNTVSVNAGLNVFQFFKLLNNYSDETTQNLNAKATASFGASYDYGINKWFSIGLAGAYNKFALTADQLQVDREDGTTYQGPIDLKVARTNIGIRPLFHYGNSGRIDMYSGFRFGVNVWNVDLIADDSLTPSDVNGRISGNTATLNVQFIPFGLRGYVSKNFAIGFETAFGSPHYAALQLSYRM